MTKLILSNSNNPFYNLAIEEWAVRNLDTSQCDYLFLYQNTDCVVVGRNQNVFQEVNLDYCKKNNITICRRVSGGGTVFHDLNNLNWTFISKFELNKVNNYKSFSATIIDVLKSYNLNAFLNARNAIMIGDFKVSGQAQFTNRKNILSHGTLLIASNVDKLNNATLLNDIKVNSKASKSVRSNVKTIADMLQENVHVNDFIDKIILSNNINEKLNINRGGIQVKLYELQNTYQTYKWIFERASKCTIEQFKGEKLIFKIEKAKIISVKNKKGEEIHQHPFLNKLYYNY